MKSNLETTPFDSEVIDLEKDRRIFLGREHLRQRNILTSAFAMRGLLQTKGEYVASLPEKFDLDSEDSPLLTAIIDPRIRLATLLAITGIRANIDVGDIQNLEAEKVLIPKTPYVARMIIEAESSLDSAFDLKENPRFRGATANEAAFFSLLFPEQLQVGEKIYAFGSRMKKIWVPYIEKARDRAIEMGSDLSIDSKNHGKLKLLLVAR